MRAAVVCCCERKRCVRACVREGQGQAQQLQIFIFFPLPLFCKSKNFFVSLYVYVVIYIYFFSFGFIVVPSFRFIYVFLLCFFVLLLHFLHFLHFLSKTSLSLPVTSSSFFIIPLSTLYAASTLSAKLPLYRSFANIVIVIVFSGVP